MVVEPEREKTEKRQREREREVGEREIITKNVFSGKTRKKLI